MHLDNISHLIRRLSSTNHVLRHTATQHVDTGAGVGVARGAHQDESDRGARAGETRDTEERIHGGEIVPPAQNQTGDVDFRRHDDFRNQLYVNPDTTISELSGGGVSQVEMKVAAYGVAPDTRPTSTDVLRHGTRLGEVEVWCSANLGLVVPLQIEVMA